jgi:hypothetical protein
MSRLVQYTAQVFVAFCRTAAGVLFGTFFLAGTGSHPGGELGRRRKRACRQSYFGNDLLRGINTETGHFGQPDHSILVRLHGLRDQTVQLRNLLIEQSQSLQFEREHLPVHGLRSSRQRFDQLFFAALQSMISQQRQVLRIGLAIGQSMQDAKTA